MNCKQTHGELAYSQQKKYLTHMKTIAILAIAAAALVSCQQQQQQQTPPPPPAEPIPAPVPCK